jgi:hypothetical protein
VRVARTAWPGWSRLVFLAAAVGLISLVAVACGSGEGTTGSESAPVTTSAATSISGDAQTSDRDALATPVPNWIAISEEIHLVLATPDLGVGTQRFGVVLSDNSGLIKFPIVRLTSNYFPNGYEADSDSSFSRFATARFYEFPFGTRGIHSTSLEFSQVGLWSVSGEIPRPDGSTAPFEVRFPVAESAMSVTVGQKAPPSNSRTLASVGDIADLTTGSHRDPELYRYSISEALDRERPLLIVFASPAFCTNAVCGPQVEVASELREVYGDRVDFVHVDLYSNPREIQSDLDKAVLSPLLEEWGLVSQEWTFIVDSDGTVTHRFENFAPKPELTEALDQSVAAGTMGTTG